MNKKTTIIAILLGVSLMGAANVNDVLKPARRMSVNDSVPQALSMLETQLDEGKWSEKDAFSLYLEKGDILLYYVRLPEEAAKIYEGLTKNEVPKDEAGSLYYRLGLAYERSEDFLRAARAYEKIITDFTDSPFHAYALSAIERCFIKNYQIKAADVDGYPISELEVEDIASKLSPAEQQNVSTPEGRKELVERIIYERLLKQAATREFAPVESTEVSIRLNCHSCRPKKVLIPGILSDEKLRQRITEDTRGVLIRELYKKEVLDRIEITDKEKKNYYKEHTDRFTNPAKYTVREIVTDSVKLDSVLAALGQGIPFDSTAKLYSSVPTASKGGSLGTRTLYTLPETIQPVAETLKVGSVSKPYTSDRGIEIISLEARTDKSVTPYEQVLPTIEDFIKRDKMTILSDNALARFYQDAQVDSIPSGDTLACVAGIIILNADLDKYMIDMDPRLQTQLEDTLIRKRALAQMISDMVFDHELAQQKLFLNDSLSNITESKRRQDLVDFYLDKEVDKKAEPSDEEIENYYKEHKKDYWNPAQVVVREMLFSSQDTAKMVYRLLQDGTPFDSLAKIYSRQEVTGPRGGYAGYIKEGASGKPYEKQAFKLKPESFSKPLQTSEGYWIIKVEKKNDAYQQTFEDSKMQIRNTLFQEKKKAAEDALREMLMSAVNITIFSSATEVTPYPEPVQEDQENSPNPGEDK